MDFKTLLTFAFLMLFSFMDGLADEAMWPLYDLDKLDFGNLKARGLQLTADQITNPERVGVADAVIGITGGTASFVSPNGLIVTNHHIAYSAIQKQSTSAKNLLTEGFYATGMKDEIPAIGFYAYVTLSAEDVTARVLAAVDDSMTALQRFEFIEQAIKEIISEAEAGHDVECSVSAMYGGRQYILYTEFKIKDVRLVYAPPEAIGRFGDEIDNWMWPRHSGDFSFLRAYVAPDGSSAEYSEGNVPFKPKSFLSFSSRGVDKGDLAILLGFPGKTDRYASSHYIDYLFNFRYPRILEIYRQVLDLMDTAARQNPETALRLASSQSNIENYQKKFKGLMEGYHRLDMLTKKREIESALKTYINSDKALTDEFGDLFDRLDSLYLIKSQTREKDFILDRLLWGCDLLNYSCDLHKWAIEREKQDKDRERGYQDRDTTKNIKNFKNVQINLVPAVDKMILRLIMQIALKLPEDQRIKAIDDIFAKHEPGKEELWLDKFLDDLYTNTDVDEISGRLDMFHMSQKELENLDDRFIQFAVSLRPELDKKENRDKAFKGAQKRLTPELIRAYLAWKPGQLYPDANGTKRINFGEVAGFYPRDAVYYYFLTSLTGVMEKETGKFPFLVPDELKSAYASQDFEGYIDDKINDVPVNFTTTNCGTNGNSGSPVLNGRGEIIGLDFDGNFESVADDYMYNPAVSRSINCDTRYLLFLIDKVYHLERLLDEITIK